MGNESEGWGSGEVGGDGSETGLVTTKNGGKKSTTGIGVSFTPDFRDKEKRNMFVKRSHELSLFSSKMSKPLAMFCVQVNIELS